MEALSSALVRRQKVVLRDIPVSFLKRGQYQPRQHFSEEGIQSLAETIKNLGVIEPLVVRPATADNYEIIAGERRWRAAQIAGLETLPCLVGCYTDAQASQIALVENLAREDLNVIEIAQGIERMLEEFNYTHEEAAKILGKPRSQVTNLLRLVKLDERVKAFLSAGELTEAHGKVLAGLPIDKQYYFAKLAVEKKWTIRVLVQSLELNAQHKKKNPEKIETKDVHVKKLEQEVSDQFGHSIQINMQKEKAGGITIRFHTLDELDGILFKLGYKPS